jgi:hypothetical protein
MWRNGITVQRLGLDPMFIDVQITCDNVTWRFTGMYGEFRWANKHLTWGRMRDLHQSNNNLPWMMMGDLNDILFLHEKEGGNPRPQQYMVAFQQAIDDCNLHDMGYVGDIFTWRRGRI